MNRMTIGTGLALGAALLASASSALANDDVYVGGSAGAVFKLDTKTGATSFAGTCGGPINSMAIQGNDILTGDVNGTIYRIDLDQQVPVDAFSVDSDLTSMVRFGGDLFITGSSGHVFRIDSESGDEVDSYYSGEPLSAMTIFGNTMYVGAPSTFIYSAPVGQDLGPFSVCGGIVNSMTTDGEHLIVGATHGIVYVFNAETGNYERTFAVASDCTALLYLDGDLLVSSSSGVVHRVDFATGVTEATFTTGLQIAAMASRPACDADFNGDGTTNSGDFLAFLNAWTADQASADMDGNGLINTQDVLIFLNAFTSGCNGQ